MARMIVADHDYVSKRYNLQKLKEVEELVAEAVQVCLPVNLSTSGANEFIRSTFLSTILLQASA